MRIILLLLSYILLTALLLTIGGGIGYFLHLLFPKIELGISVLIGVVTTGMSLHFYGKLLMSIPSEDDPSIEVIDNEELIKMFRTRLTMDSLPQKIKRRRK
jgi:hypothetical protein